MHHPTVGDIISREINRRSIVLGGEEIPYKCAGTKSSQTGNNDFCYNKGEVNFHPCQNGQHGNPALSNEYGGHKKTRK